jgi:hypothetical protein
MIASATMTALGQSGSTIVVRTDQAALISLDGRTAGTAQAFAPFETPATPGTHQISAVLLGGTESSEQTVQVNAGQRAYVLLSLTKAHPLQSQPPQDEQQKELAAAQKQQCRDQLQAKRSEYNNLVQQYMSEMQQAAQAQQLAQLNDNASTGPNNWLGALNKTLGSYNKSQVTVHRTKQPC